MYLNKTYSWHLIPCAVCFDYKLGLKTYVRHQSRATVYYIFLRRTTKPHVSVSEKQQFNYSQNPVDKIPQDVDERLIEPVYIGYIWGIGILTKLTFVHDLQYFHWYIQSNLNPQVYFSHIFIFISTYDMKFY